MSSANTATSEDYEPDASPLKVAARVLDRRLEDTLDLAAYVEQLRTDLNADPGGKLRSLLEGLLHELAACCSMFRDRIGSFTLHLRQAQRIETSNHSDWRLSADGNDYREWLESLLNRYARYVRTSSDSIAKLELLGDLESARIVGIALAAGEKGLWFIEAYMEGVALRMDRRRLPDWPRASV